MASRWIQKDTKNDMFEILALFLVKEWNNQENVPGDENIGEEVIMRLSYELDGRILSVKYMTG